MSIQEVAREKKDKRKRIERKRCQIQMCSNTSTTFEQAIQTAHANAQKALHACMH